MANLNQTLKEHYEKKYYNPKESHKPANHFKSRWPRNRFEASVHWSPKRKRVLDIGCGNGDVLFSLRNHFEELHGIDIAEVRIRDCIKSFSGLKATFKVVDWTAPI